MTYLIFFVCCILYARAEGDELASIYGCSEHFTCKDCISHNPCGWCESNIIYENGEIGPQCAGKPKDPKHPPPGYRPWSCPANFQNLFCPTYTCNNKTYQCDSQNNQNGQDFQTCKSGCLPPAYICNRGLGQCVLSVFGTDKKTCEKSCVDAKYKCNKDTYTCEVATDGDNFMKCQLGCFPPGYFCNPANKSCYQAPPGQGDSLKNCQATCGKVVPSSPVPANNLYSCNNTDLKCNPSSEGSSFPFCQSVCGNASNVTPVEIIGNYRGLQVNKGYVKGEWTMLISQGLVIIKDPSRKLWASGSIATYNGELWLVSTKGTYRGIDTQTQLPEVSALTWALGGLNQPAPEEFRDAMNSGTVFTMFKCVNPNICNWVLSQETKKREVDEKRQVSDPCSKYPDCASCIAALDYCGWCTVDVLYNGTTTGTQCAGVNKTKTPGFLCKGTFSTVTCPTPTPSGKGPTKMPPTKIPPLKPNGPMVPPPPSKPIILYTCDPATTTCVQNSTGSGGMPFEECNMTCAIIPDVPIILRGRKFRGLQIEKGYVVGEWTCKFTDQTVTVTDPKGTTFTAVVSQTGQFMVLNLPNNKKIFSLWQVGQGSVTDYLSWAWGAPGGAAPSSFDSAQTTPGQTGYVFDACSPLVGSSCNFGN